MGGRPLGLILAVPVVVLGAIIGANAGDTFFYVFTWLAGCTVGGAVSIVGGHPVAAGNITGQVINVGSYVAGGISGVIAWLID
jgi:hypothetical protein